VGIAIGRFERLDGDLQKITIMVAENRPGCGYNRRSPVRSPPIEPLKQSPRFDDVADPERRDVIENRLQGSTIAVDVGDRCKAHQLPL
jgi:hypothetical protein